MDVRALAIDAIAYALKSCRPILRQLVRQHTSDDEAHIAAERVVAQLERSGFKIEHDGGLRTGPGADWKKHGPE